ncbi:MAG TPA: hypothetical protein PK511_02255 [Chitinophagales bacterium]|nr:hypothetical protein [Chitinophagales bacterium]HMU69220.1 hypothetical protein [Chitinophagales bacterium]HMX04389.1 hypothetical protein [Chitinophagales bacterium]HMZ89268.1 hypothetical protein [Chitinophagales bacterium]HNA57459.1 hypothetical protein [Chitinophagales bacterium]
MQKFLQTILVVIGSLGVVISCNSGYDYWELSEFNMQPDALKDMAEIKLVYYSNGPAQVDNDGAYIHAIVTSVETGDTINILSPYLSEFSPEDGDKTFIYIGIHSNIGKAVSSDWDLDKYTKVIRDPKFDAIAHNDHPTVIGSIASTEMPFQ